jgi:hypothetical protein
MDEDLVPDDTFLSRIFRHISPPAINILRRARDHCAFRARFDIAPHPNWPDDLVVRMEISAEKLEATAALAKLARTALPDLVPMCYTIGTARTSSGRDVTYSVSEFITNSVPLDTPWPSLSWPQKHNLITPLVTALSTLHKLPLPNDQYTATTSSTPSWSAVSTNTTTSHQS